MTRRELFQSFLTLPFIRLLPWNKIVPERFMWEFNFPDAIYKTDNGTMRGAVKISMDADGKGSALFLNGKPVLEDGVIEVAYPMRSLASSALDDEMELVDEFGNPIKWEDVEVYDD